MSCFKLWPTALKEYDRPARGGFGQPSQLAVRVPDLSGELHRTDRDAAGGCYSVIRRSRRLTLSPRPPPTRPRPRRQRLASTRYHFASTGNHATRKHEGNPVLSPADMPAEPSFVCVSVKAWSSGESEVTFGVSWSSFELGLDLASPYHGKLMRGQDSSKMGKTGTSRLAMEEHLVSHTPGRRRQAA